MLDNHSVGCYTYNVSPSDDVLTARKFPSFVNPCPRTLRNPHNKISVRDPRDDNAFSKTGNSLLLGRNFGPVRGSSRRDMGMASPDLHRPEMLARKWVGHASRTRILPKAGAEDTTVGRPRNDTGGQNVLQNKRFIGREGESSKTYSTETKRVTFSIGDDGEKEGGLINEGLSQNAFENNRDINLIWIKFSGRPECS